MPEITDAEYRQFVRYQSLGTPEELEKQAKKIAELEADNKAQRDEIRALKEQVPKEGMVAVPKEKADALARYEALGKPEELEAAVKERETLRAELAQRNRRDAIRQAVQAMGWPEDVVATLEDLRSLDGATFEVRTETVDGKQVQVPYVTLAGDGQKPQKLADFASSTPALRGLKTEAQQSSGKTESPRFPVQPKDGGSPTPADRVEEFIKKRNEAAAARPNPLLPKQ